MPPTSSDIFRPATLRHQRNAAAALDYAERGFSIFPCHSMCTQRCSCRKQDCPSPGKHPRIASGFKVATVDLDTVQTWWTRWADANIGMPTGSWCTVIDIDPRHGGDRSLHDLEDAHGALPRTVEARTGGGGTHFYFAIPDGVVITNRNNAAPGIDVRGSGGYVLLPPSNHHSGGRYAWVRHPEVVEVADMPGWLLALLCKEGSS